MAEPGGRGRSALRIPRVEFDLAGLVLGSATVVVWQFLWQPLASLLAVDPSGLRTMAGGGTADATAGVALKSALFGVVQRAVPVPGVDAVCAMLGAPGPLLRAVPDQGPDKFAPAWPDVAAWKLGVAAAVVVLVAAVLGGALARVYAVRKAKDRSVPFDEALGYSCGTIGQFVTAPVFTVAAGALFVAGILASGAAAAIPYAGPVLQIVLQPLSAILAVFAAMIAIGLVLGFPILVAAVAVERNGALDAVSRTFSYVWTRPVPFAISGAIVVAVASVASRVALWAVGLGHALFASGANLADGALAQRIALAFQSAATLASPPTDGLAGPAVASVWVAWAIGAFVIVAAQGFVVSYVAGGFTDVYFMLREDVDGVDPSEVFVEGAGEPLR